LWVFSFVDLDRKKRIERGMESATVPERFCVGFRRGVFSEKGKPNEGRKAL
jgi:hypothetical protein